MPSAEPASVLDASALLAVVHEEPGAEAVTDAIGDGAAEYKGLSLADRCCLALAKRKGLPVKTADNDWVELDVGVTVELIR